MAITDYAGLRNEIANEINNAERVSHIPNWIVRAEALFNRKLRLMAQVKRATVTTTLQTFPFPSDVLELISPIKVNTAWPYNLTYVSPEIAGRNWGGHVGQPGAYTISGNKIRFAAPLDGEYTVELVYYTKIPALTETNQTNFLLSAHPDLYFYGALAESGDPRIEHWIPMRDVKLNEVIGADQAARYSGGSLRIRVA